MKDINEVINDYIENNQDRDSHFRMMPKIGFCTLCQEFPHNLLSFLNVKKQKYEGWMICRRCSHILQKHPYYCEEEKK